jgi:hypothetical protein
MSYTLNLYFKPAVRRERVLRYFGQRRNFRVVGDGIVYEHPNTRVSFSINLYCSRDITLQRTVQSAAFELDYRRPSYFGIEAEKELSAFVEAFRPRIDDPQIDGMGECPYRPEGFINGWNFGNVFSMHNALSSNPDLNIVAIPVDELLAAWRWNYDCDQRSETARFFLPEIMFFRVDDRPCRVAIWPEGMPVSLPRVDLVLVGQIVAGEKRFGLVSWAEILSIARQAGFNTANTPLEIEYFRKPPEIERWVSSRPLIDLDALEQISWYQVFDEELIAAAREFEKRIAG